MLTRIDDVFRFLEVAGGDELRVRRVAEQYAEIAEGMTHRVDYETLGAIAMACRPRRIFEIGTYLGVTSDFFLTLLPECRVVSIAYENPVLSLLGRRSNNSELSRHRIGSMVSGANRMRFTQLLGDSHKLNPADILQRFGPIDLVFVDGDHSREGVKQDTTLALALVQLAGTICWHDANPKPAYQEVREYLEQELTLNAIATPDDYVGGVAVWNAAIDERLRRVRIYAD